MEKEEPKARMTSRNDEFLTFKDLENMCCMLFIVARSPIHLVIQNINGYYKIVYFR